MATVDEHRKLAEEARRQRAKHRIQASKKCMNSSQQAGMPWPIKLAFAPAGAPLTGARWNVRRWLLQVPGEAALRRAAESLDL